MSVMPGSGKRISSERKIMNLLTERMVYSNFYMRPGDKKWSEVLITDESKQIVASASVAPDYYGDGRAMIWSVKVEEQWRGHKFGELLMIYALLEACRRGYTKVSLHVDSINNVARKLYEKLGFQYEKLVPDKVTHERFYYDEDYPEFEENLCPSGCCSYDLVEVCSVPWANWLMTMNLDLNADTIRALKNRRKVLRRRIAKL